jgi:peptide chain release factor 2
LLKERTALQKIVDSWGSCDQEVEDLLMLCELGQEGEDQATLEEISALLPALEQKVGKMEFARMLSGPHDANNAIFSINAGAGGTEAQDWGDMLLRMYLRYCEKKGFRTEITDYQPGDEAGIKGVTFTVEGEYAYGYLRAEMGIHRLVRISPFDSNARRHTSFCSVFAFPELSDDVEVEINEKDLRVDTYRSSGAGGQHVNKTDSAIRITHIPTGVVVECQDERSQHKNRSRAMSLLRARLLEAQRQKQTAQQAQERKLQVGTGDRSERIRTYNYPQGRVTDHRVNLTLYQLPSILDGALGDVIGPLQQEWQAEQLASLE